MKQFHYLHSSRWGVGLLLSGILLGCSDEMHLLTSSDGGDGLRFELQASIDQVNETRADESGFANGDRFGLFVVNYSGGDPGTLTLSDNQVNNVAITYNADANSWQSATDIYWSDPITPADVYGYYPFYNGMSDVDAYNFEVKSDQSIVGTDGEMGSYEASDLLWAKTSKATPGKKVELTFSHIMAGVKVVLQQGSGFEGDAWTKLTKTVTVDNTVRTSEVDLSKGIVTPSGNFDRNIVMNPEGDAWRAVVVPQSVAAGKTIIGITIDGKPYAYSRTDGMKYTAGKLHTFTIKIDRKADSGDYTLTLVNEDITPWEADKSSHDFVENAYVTVSCQQAGKLRDVLNEQRIDFNTIRNLKINGNINTEDFRLMRDELFSLSALNLKNVKIVAGELWLNEDTFPEITEEEDVLPNEAFFGKSTLRRVILPENLKKIGSSSFTYASLNSTITIPETVTHICSGAFSMVNEGSTIVMPHHLEYIGTDAFYECKSSIEVILTNSIRYIGKTAFWGASNSYGTLMIPNNLEFLGEGALTLGDRFDGEIVIPQTLTEIPDFAFFGTNLKGGTKVSFHDGITKIGSNAFSGINFASGFKLPSHLIQIGEAAFQECHFSNDFELPASIQVIGVGAFTYSNFGGDLIIPDGVEMLSPTPLGECLLNNGSFGNTMIENLIIGDNVEMIGGRAFWNNTYLASVEIGKNVDRIGMQAFAYCPGLQRVVSLAKEPPKLYNEVFIGFDPLHCHLEVPEESIEAYKTADGWKDFNFISAHRELSVGITQQSCLNKGISRSVTLYSEGAWKVKECPEWIRVTPAYGSTKEEITFVVDPLAKGGGDRSGKVMFELIGKDYTTEFEVLQYDYEHNEDEELMLSTSSTSGRPINLFIVGDGFGAEEIVNGKYLEIVNDVMDQFFDIEPYRTYKKYFNVSTSIALSPDNKISTLSHSRASRLNTTGTDLSVSVVKDYVCKVSNTIDNASLKDAMVIVISNMESFSGNSYPDEDGCALACVSLSSDVFPYDQRGLVQHFAGGKAFAGLAVEYVNHNEHIKGCTCPYCNSLPEYYEMKAKGMFENVSLSGKMNDVPWRDFIFHPKYSDRVDMWEGGFNHMLGVWRSESQSVMSTYIPYYNTISRYVIYKSIMKRAALVPSFEDFIANDIIEIQ